MTLPTDKETVEVYQPHGHECTVHTCDRDPARWVKFSVGFVAGYCDEHADTKTGREDTEEVDKPEVVKC
jgi:hypothetical protein